MPKYAKGVSFIPTSGKAGRRFLGAKGSREATTPLSHHNQMIEDKRKADLEARKNRKGK